MDPPVVAYNALALRPDGTGVQTYIRELLTALRAATSAGLVAVVQADAAGSLPPGVVAVPQRRSSGVRRALAGLRPLPDASLVHGLDVDLPARSGVPAVATVHDLSVFDVPWTFSRRRAAGERLLVSRAVRRADALIAVSSFTAERIAARLGRQADVVLEAPPRDARPAPLDAVDALRRRLALPAVFVLHVGAVEPRKDLPTLAAAARQAGVPVVLAGPGSDRAAQALGARGLGYVDRSDLAALYGAATVVAYPTRYEGFGLPPLEAMACGAPVVASRVASLPEALGDGALLVAPGDIEAWATALRALVADEDRRDELAAAGARRAAELTWEATAQGTLDVYRRLGVDLP